MKSYIWVILKGMAMGAADVVPGVSGGTIAFIVGIYDKLLSSIAAINFGLINDLKQFGFSYVWQKINGAFLVSLFAGIFISLFSFAKILSYLLITHPIPLWGFFFGLIIASIWYVGKQVNKWNISSIIGLILGMLLVFWLSITPPLSASDNYLYLFFCGAIASCAMILPGISGSFILLLLGAYTTIITGIAEKNITILALVGAGAVTGLLSFSKLLKYLLASFPNTIIATLTGFLIGSLWKIWPWKRDLLVFSKDLGETVPLSHYTKDYESLTALIRKTNTTEILDLKAFKEINILPSTYEQINAGLSSNLPYAILFCIIGFSLIFIIEFLAINKDA